MTFNENLLAQKVLNNLKKHREELCTYHGEDRWNQYKEAILEDECSMKLQYSDDGEIHNIVLTSETNKKLRSLNITNDSNFYDECINTAKDLFGEGISRQFLYI